MEIPKPDFLHRLQGLDEGKKQKTMIVAAVIIMVVVIYLWSAYFNSMVVGQSTVTQQTQTAEPSVSQ
jgi:hypothetical protein